MALPDLAAPAAEARRNVVGLRVHPDYDRLARTRDRLTRQESVIAAGRQPRVSAFGRAGYGRPGINPVNDEFDTWYAFGVQVRWAPWTWGSTGREREALTLQREILATEEAALAASLARAVQTDLADIDRLDAALALDDEIVALRERVEAEARLRFTEGVMTATDYLDRGTDALDARLTRSAHRIEQVQARARLLNTLGLEIH
jgi:outer membrane protein TolC